LCAFSALQHRLLREDEVDQEAHVSPARPLHRTPQLSVTHSL
jgi:hypothetical protein